MLDADLYSEDEPPPPDPIDTGDPETSEKLRLDAELPGSSAIEGGPVSNPSSAQPPAPESTAVAIGGDTSPPIQASAASLLSALSAEDSSQAAALSMFGADFRSLGAHMMVHTTKLKGYLEAIKPSSDPLVRYSALQELNELLVMSNEDTLSGYFQVDAFTKELIGILGGKRTGGDEEDEEEREDDHDEDDEDSALAAALAMSGGNVFTGDENPEAQVLASRCLYNMMEALPGTAHTVVFHGAIPALCSKLLEIQFIDLAEQNISVSEIVLCILFSLDNVALLNSRPWIKFQRNVPVLLLARVGSQHCSTSSTFSTPPSSVQQCMQQPIAAAMRRQMCSRQSRMCCQLFKAFSRTQTSASSSPLLFV